MDSHPDGGGPAHPQKSPRRRNYCHHLIPDGEPGRLWLMHLSADGGLILTESLGAPGGYPRPRQVVERALASRARALVLASGRAGAAIAPGDGAFAGTLSELLAMIGVTLLDALVLDGERFASFRRAGLLTAPLREPPGAGIHERAWSWPWDWDGEP